MIVTVFDFSTYYGSGGVKDHALLESVLERPKSLLTSNITDLQEEYNCEDVLPLENYEDKIFTTLWWQGVFTIKVKIKHFLCKGAKTLDW